MGYHCQLLPAWVSPLFFSSFYSPPFLFFFLSKEILYCEETDGLCENGGTCTNFVGGYSCLCTSSFKGLNCSTAIETAQTSNGLLSLSLSCLISRPLILFEPWILLFLSNSARSWFGSWRSCAVPSLCTCSLGVCCKTKEGKSEVAHSWGFGSFFFPCCSTHSVIDLSPFYFWM